MAEKKEKYYKVSSRKLKNNGIKYYVIIDDTVKPTTQELEDIKMYLQSGYTIKHKSKDRAERQKREPQKQVLARTTKRRKPKNNIYFKAALICGFFYCIYTKRNNNTKITIITTKTICYRCGIVFFFWI